MKRLISLLALTALTSTSATSVVACNKPKEQASAKEQKNNKEEANKEAAKTDISNINSISDVNEIPITDVITFNKQDIKNTIQNNILQAVTKIEPNATLADINYEVYLDISGQEITSLDLTQTKVTIYVKIFANINSTKVKGNTDYIAVSLHFKKLIDNNSTNEILPTEEANTEDKTSITEVESLAPIALNNITEILPPLKVNAQDPTNVTTEEVLKALEANVTIEVKMLGAQAIPYVDFNFSISTYKYSNTLSNFDLTFDLTLSPQTVFVRIVANANNKVFSGETSPIPVMLPMIINSKNSSENSSTINDYLSDVSDNSFVHVEDFD